MEDKSDHRVEEIVDTHVHLVDRNRISYPWLESAASLDRDWGYEEYAQQARALGISRAIHMEVDVAERDIEAEIDWIDELINAHDGLMAGMVAACRPENDGFAREVERAASRPSIVGFRRALHVVPDDVSRSQTFRDNIRRLGPVGLPFDLCVAARQLPIAIELADAAPEVRFVLDHCGVPDIAAGAWDDWARDITAISRRPNVCAKVSGIVAYAAEGWAPGDLARWVDHVTGAFGFERLCWGGDWPVCTLGGGLATWVAASRAIFTDASASERARLYTNTAREVWGV